MSAEDGDILMIRPFNSCIYSGGGRAQLLRRSAHFSPEEPKAYGNVKRRRLAYLFEPLGHESKEAQS